MRFLWTLVIGLTLVSADGRSRDIADEPFFQFLVGSWGGEGELINREGEKTIIKEEWSAAFDDDGTFTVKGTRQWGDDRQEFRWEYSFNQSTELYECLYWHSGMEEELRFEASLTKERVELRSPLGDPRSELLVVNQREEKTVNGKVTLTDSNQTQLLKIEMIHKRKE